MQTYKTRAGYVVAALILSTAGLLPVSLAAQESVPVFIAIPERFPDVDARVVILREPGREIVVLNPASAGVTELGTGLSLLRRLRRERGQPTRGQMIPIVGFSRAPNLTPRDRARLETALDQLRTRPMANVGNLGRGRWLRLPDR
ncbi:MAG: hypothetical protein ABL963_02305 [Longimicrobiales bacterium]